MAELLILVQLVTTLAMVGVIWFVQVVHYPLFGKVGIGGFREYEQSHQRRTTLVVAPLMVTEAITAVCLLWLRPAEIPLVVAGGGAGLVGLLWASTFFWQVPAHERLAKSFDTDTHRTLVRSNWLRTTGWSARGVLVCWMLVQILTANNGRVTVIN